MALSGWFAWMSNDDVSRTWIEAYVYPDRLQPGQTVVIQAGLSQLKPVDGGGQARWVATAVADGPVKPCRLVPDEDGLPPWKAADGELQG
jgi:hypothetical protein